MLEYLLICSACCPSVLYFWKGSKPFRQHSESKSNLVAKDLFPEIFRQERNLRKDIAILSVTNVPTVAHVGNNLSPHAAILISGNLANIDRDMSNYFCKHHLSQIMYSDDFKASMYAAGSSALVATTIPFVLRYCPVLSFATCYMSYVIANKVYEETLKSCKERADAFASEYATDEELIAAEQFASTRIKSNKNLHRLHPKYFSKLGEPLSRSYLKNEPSATNILKSVQNELRRRVRQNKITDPKFLKKRNNIEIQKKLALFHMLNDAKYGKFD